jgi:hypothetical protein
MDRSQDPTDEHAQKEEKSGMTEDDFPPKSISDVLQSRRATSQNVCNHHDFSALTHDHASRVHRFAGTPSLPGFPLLLQLLSCFVNLYHPQNAINLSLFVFVQRWRSTCDGEPGAIISFTLQSTGLLAAAPVVSFLWTAGSAVWVEFPGTHYSTFCNLLASSGFSELCFR